MQLNESIISFYNKLKLMVQQIVNRDIIEFLDQNTQRILSTKQLLMSNSPPALQHASNLVIRHDTLTNLMKILNTNNPTVKAQQQNYIEFNTRNEVNEFSFQPNTLITIVQHNKISLEKTISHLCAQIPNPIVLQQRKGSTGTYRQPAECQRQPVTLGIEFTSLPSGCRQQDKDQRNLHGNKTEPEIWFNRRGAQFRAAGIIADATKFDYTIANLNHGVLSEVIDIIRKPPDTKIYDPLKHRLIKRSAVSQTNKICKLMGDITLGDQTPSQLLHKLQILIKGNTSENPLLGTIATKHESAVIVTRDEDLEMLADRIQDTNELSKIQNIQEQASPSNEIQEQIRQLRKQMKMLTERPNNQIPKKVYSRGPNDQLDIC
ncbi:hypothetical protein GWI33_005161 [Rhynchophorus ferrugineus]|uniref:DUF7041 domain-containing protein n=1 Tax=Rhynchophorus ferrugineus TaxID=354439 RepID=A0A834IM36_RHYFE|nr:hypothetical protein GWI33_005161 [Rhynchophorus ferrugineus]